MAIHDFDLLFRSESALQELHGRRVGAVGRQGLLPTGAIVIAAPGRIVYGGGIPSVCCHYAG